MGGSYQSNLVKSTIKIINETIVKVENNVRQSTEQTCSERQHLTFTTGEKSEILGRLVINQKAQLVCNLDANATGKMSAEILNQVQNKIDEAIKNSNEATLEFLNTGTSTGTNRTDLEKFLHSRFEAAIENTFTQDCSQNLEVLQTLNVFINGKITGDMDMSQNAQATAIASCIMQYVSDAIAQNEHINDIISEIDNKNKAEHQGLGSLFAGITIAIIAAIIIVGFIYYGYKGSKSSKGR